MSMLFFLRIYRLNLPAYFYIYYFLLYIDKSIFNCRFINVDLIIAITIRLFVLIKQQVFSSILSTYLLNIDTRHSFTYEDIHIPKDG